MIDIFSFFFFNNFVYFFNCSDFRPTSLEKSQELLRLRIYQVYAWGVPLVIAGVAAILDNLPKTADDTFLRPRFGEKSCWFFGKYAKASSHFFFRSYIIIVFFFRSQLICLNYICCCFLLSICARARRPFTLKLFAYLPVASKFTYSTVYAYMNINRK